MRHRLFAPWTPWIWLAVLAMALVLAACPGGGNGGY
jgi:hypothetical protein